MIILTTITLTFSINIVIVLIAFPFNLFFIAFELILFGIIEITLLIVLTIFSSIPFSLFPMFSFLFNSFYSPSSSHSTLELYRLSSCSYAIELREGNEKPWIGSSISPIFIHSEES